jgi:hypothetical protein
MGTGHCQWAVFQGSVAQQWHAVGEAAAAHAQQNPRRAEAAAAEARPALRTRTVPSVYLDAGAH